MADPARAARLWLARAVATVLLTRHGAADEAAAPTPTPTRDRRRTLSVFGTGLLLVQAALLAGALLPRGRFVPEPWPRSTPAIATVTVPNQPP